MIAEEFPGLIVVSASGSEDGLADGSADGSPVGIVKGLLHFSAVQQVSSQVGIVMFVAR